MNTLDVNSPTLSNFSISSNEIKTLLDGIDTAKMRGSNGLPPTFFYQTRSQVCLIVNKLFENMKSLRKLPASSKTPAVARVFKKGNPRNVESYRPLLLLCIDNKIFEKCVYNPLCQHFRIYNEKSTGVCAKEIRYG